MRGPLVFVTTIVAVILMHITVHSCGDHGAVQAMPSTAAVDGVATPGGSMGHAGHVTAAAAAPVVAAVVAAPAMICAEHSHGCVFIRVILMFLLAAALLLVAFAADRPRLVRRLSQRLMLLTERPPPWTVPTRPQLSVYLR